MPLIVFNAGSSTGRSASSRGRGRPWWGAGGTTITGAAGGAAGGTGIQTHVLVENNVYSNVSNPLSPDANGDMLARGNLFQMTRGTTTATGVGFTPPYP